MSERPFTPERLAKRPATVKRAVEPASPVAYSPKTFEEAFGIGHTKLYEEIASGRLIARKIGRRTIILASDAESWARSLPLMRKWGKVMGNV